MSGEGTSSTTTGDTIQNQLSSLVPTFDPAVDSVETWTQKVELLVNAWPEGKYKELATRIILNTKGSAFQKLQLRSAEILTGDKKGIQVLVETVGGQFGQVDLERKFDVVERALFRCVQKADESADSYLARTDIAWTEMNMKKIDLAEVQAYITLRGGRLSPEDKKRVLVEAGAEQGSKLEMKKVTAAIRMLGSSFFHEYTSGKRDKSQKVYDHTAYSVDEVKEVEEANMALPEDFDEEMLEGMANDDEDAALVIQFENAIIDTVQEDSELALFFSSYQEARKHLREKMKSRGFWNTSGKSQKGSGKRPLKGKFSGKSRGFKPLSQRIAESYCKKCLQRGHWKAECPNPPANKGSATSTVPTSFVVAMDPLIATIPEAENDTLMQASWQKKHAEVCLFSEEANRLVAWKDRLKQKLNQLSGRNRVLPSPRTPESCQKSNLSEPCIDICFASSDIVGVVDLGASKSVIGEEQLCELVPQLPENIRSKLRRVPCHLVFRFGNHQTLTSRVAIRFPLLNSWFQVAVVQGKTPFLLSSSFLKNTLKAVIDTDAETVWSKSLQQELKVTLTEKNLFLMDINQLWEARMPKLEQGGLQVQETLNVETTENEPKEKMQPASEDLHDETVEKFAKHVKPQIPRNSKLGNPISFRKALALFRQKEQEVSIEQVKLKSQPCISSEPVPVSCSPNTDSPHVAERQVEGIPKPPGEERKGADQSCSPGRVEGDVNRRDGQPQSPIRRSQSGTDVCRSLSGCKVDQLCDFSLREQLETRTQGVCELRESPCGDRAQSCQNPEEGKFRDGSSGNVGAKHRSPSGEPSSRSVQTGESPQSSGRGDGRSDRAPATPSNEPTYSMDNGEGRANPTLSESEVKALSTAAEIAQVLNDQKFDFEPIRDPKTMTFMRKVQKLKQEFWQELHEISKVILKKRKKTFLFEVMCSPQSEITRQCLKFDMEAKRFGLDQGDLSKKDGRKNLFAHLIAEEPDHVWTSLECRPWCKWTSLNMSKSEESGARILEDREKNLWQISLALVLFEFQQMNKKQFHFEQPEGSLMLNLPCLKPLFSRTLRCDFDMCTMGNLREPIYSMPIRKRLVVLTTSKEFAICLRNRFCRQNHDHLSIAGSTVVHGKSMNLSKYTEMYPRKFARQIVGTLIQSKKKGSQDMVILTGETVEEEHPTKRRRVGQKSSLDQIHEMAARPPVMPLEAIMRTVDKTAFRVGIRVVETGPIIDMLNLRFPEKKISHVILCRGTDRCNGPSKTVSPGEAPLRRRIIIRRKHEDIVDENEWEPWEKLSNLKLRRKGEPARVSMTIFARNKNDMRNYEESRETQASNGGQREGLTQGASQESSERAMVRCEESTTPVTAREEIDLTSQKHGPMMLELSSSEQAWLMKVHNNLGYPGHQKLMNFCKQINCFEKILKAIPDLKCSTCLETQRPCIARPSAVHEKLDFNDIVSMDGISWTNKLGKQFHFYHFVDHSTTFHTAWSAPTRLPAEAIRALNLAWINWCGAPGMLCLDAATEFASEEFLSFL